MTPPRPVRAIAALLLALAGAAAANPMVHRDGRRLVDGQGRTVILRGVNLGGWLQWEGWMMGKGILTTDTDVRNRLTELVGEPAMWAFRERMIDAWITAADLDEIARLGFNSVRVPIHWRQVQRPDPPYAERPEGWAALDRVVDGCERRGLRVILDLHAAPGGQSGFPPVDPGPRRERLWRSATSASRTEAVWRAVAARYRSRTIVAGYDLLNEPLPPGPGALTGMYARLIAAIRAVDPDHLVILEGNDLALDLSWIDRRLDPNEALSFHMYTWFGDDRWERLSRFSAHAAKLDDPLWAGEFGENTVDMIRSTVALYEKPVYALCGWSFWPWKRTPSRFPGLRIVAVPPHWRPVIDWIGGWFRARPDRATALAGMDELVDAAALDRTTLNPAMLAALREPAGLRDAVPAPVPPAP